MTYRLQLDTASSLSNDDVIRLLALLGVRTAVFLDGALEGIASEAGCTSHANLKRVSMSFAMKSVTSTYDRSLQCTGLSFWECLAS